RASLTDRVALSTVTINLLTEEAVPDEPPTGFLTGLASGWKALVSFLTALVSTVGVLLPWLGLAAVVTLVVWPLARRARRRSAARRPGGPSATLPVPGPVPGPPPAPPGPQPTAPDRD
ncbi:MAG TPA: DUF4349 domain-containing protein, partial [Actinotalea sp.]|nr:DUF4349 domain-containing protein [Actinotalea sp.]